MKPFTFRLSALGLAGLTIVLLAPVPGFAHEPQSDAESVSLTGELTIIQVDDFENGRADKSYFLRDGQNGRAVEIRFKGKPPEELRSGSIIRVKGKAKDKEIEVAADDPGNTEVLQEAAALVVAGRMDVALVLVNFLDATVECSPSAILGTVLTNPQSVDGLYRETSYGNVYLAGNTFGPYTINYRVANSCDYMGWSSAADAAAQAAGVNLSGYSSIVYVLPKSINCGWLGRGTLGGSPGRAWVAACDYPTVYAHELGHNLAMGHAASDENNDGLEDCAYCDRSDFMSDSLAWRQLNAPHRAALGWTPANKIVEVTADGVFNLAPLEVNPTGTPHPQILKVLRKPDLLHSEYYYLSYRQPVGYDATLTSWANNTAVHRFDDVVYRNTFWIRGVQDGQTFEDSVRGVYVSQISHNSQYATVEVSFRCEQVPPSASSSTSTLVKPGTTVNYTITIQNRDCQTFSASTFQLNPVLPGGWTGSVSPASLSLSPGGTGTSAFPVTSPTGTPDGSYQLTVTVSDSAAPVHNVSIPVTYSVDGTPPTAPTGLTAPYKAGKVQLKWTGSTDSNGVASYSVWRNGTKIADTPNVSYADSPPGSGTFSYYVTAQDGVGNVSGPSNTATVSVKGGKR